MHAFVESLMILIFEALGTGMLTMLFIASTTIDLATVVEAGGFDT